MYIRWKSRPRGDVCACICYALTSGLSRGQCVTCHGDCLNKASNSDTLVESDARLETLAGGYQIRSRILSQSDNAFLLCGNEPLYDVIVSGARTSTYGPHCLDLHMLFASDTHAIKITGVVSRCLNLRLLD